MVDRTVYPAAGGGKTSTGTFLTGMEDIDANHEAKCCYHKLEIADLFSYHK